MKRWTPLAEVLEQDVPRWRNGAAFLSDFAEALIRRVRRGQRILVPGLGLFELGTRRARRIRNPATGKLMQLPATRSLKLRPVKASRRLSRLP